MYVMRKAHKTINALSIGGIVGFTVSLVISFDHIVANRYIQHQMFRLIALDFQESLNKYVPLAVVSIASFIILSLLWKLVFSYAIKVRTIKNWNTVRTFLACIACSIFFFYGGWAINYYWLPHKFHPISLLCDVGILLFAILLGWVLIRGRWGNMAKVLEVKYIGRIAFILHHPRPLHQHLNILLLVLFLSLDGQDEPSRNSIELVFRKANEVFFLDLPETKRDTLAAGASIALARLWGLFVM